MSPETSSSERTELAKADNRDEKNTVGCSILIGVILIIIGVVYAYLDNAGYVSHSQDSVIVASARARNRSCS